MSPEEFFMYLTIALVIVVPIAARLYRRLTLSRTTELLREQLQQAPKGGSSVPPERPQ
ncbi:MAG: hypothetical protein NBKEAIPA_03599 [Nitrospirae bacterium]|nr:MAG: hypothetical protein UZ03_NOB001001417 [Nitrospira sp. OLB3]MBV6471664.1 hypothetical protein [Nitrospirota bacterium]MCK6499325.1 hypothetical protein [Nitrospira sp.]MEB2337203.1 hypothetical protein [Nitrospirales bacterium]QOJ34435.1 MAG: hypothetical protein HRU82_05495 [Nitrospira sp.]